MKIFSLKNYSILTKTLILFFFISVLIIVSRTLLAHPKIKSKNIKYDINLISTTLLLTKDLINKESDKEKIKKSLLENLKFKSIKIDFFESDLINDNFLMVENVINDIPFLVWTIKLEKLQANKKLFLRLSLDKEELESKYRIDILVAFLLQESFFVIVISLFLFLFFFRKMLNNIELLNKKIKKSLEEKEILLKEIHHRVKNNLALTISLLELQEEEIEDEKTKKVLIDIQERIYTMELLHRKLYESPNLNKISLENYIIDLIKAISKSYDKEKKVTISFDIENIDLDIETAMPYGLILNELVTNAFKYAFKNQKNPQLQITISKQENEKILLIVKDSGKGLLGDFSKISNETLGLRLINMIVKYQLMGNITYEYENGAKFIILGKIKE